MFDSKINKVVYSTGKWLMDWSIKRECKYFLAMVPPVGAVPVDWSDRPNDVQIGFTGIGIGNSNFPKSTGFYPYAH